MSNGHFPKTVEKEDHFFKQMKYKRGSRYRTIKERQSLVFQLAFCDSTPFAYYESRLLDYGQKR